MSIKTRLARLERASAARRVWPLAWPSVEAAAAAGVRGGWLQVGPVMSLDEWMATAPAQQAELTKGHHHAIEH